MIKLVRVEGTYYFESQKYIFNIKTILNQQKENVLPNGAMSNEEGL